MCRPNPPREVDEQMTQTGDRKRNVAICAPGEFYGGVERFVFTLAMRLRDERKISPLVVLFDKGKQDDELREAGIETVVVKPRWKYDFLVVRRLARLFRDREIDIVHTNGYKSTILGAAAARVCGIPAIKTEHGRIEPRKAYSFGLFRMRFNLMLDEIFTRTLIDHVVYVTQNLRSMFHADSRTRRNSVVYNAIPDVSADPDTDASDIDRSAFNLGIIGRISEVKGHRVLLSALAELTDLPDIRVNVIGEGPLRGELEDYCRNHNLVEKVKFLGFKSNVHNYTSALDVLVMPSLHEGLPYTLLEGMYLKVPIIATDVGGLKEILDDRIDALLVEAGNDKALSRAIRYLHDNENERKRLAENAYTKVCRDFNISKMAREYIELYLANGKPGEIFT